MVGPFTTHASAEIPPSGDRPRAADDRDGRGCLLDRVPAGVANGLSSLDWELRDARADGHTHGLHPYPAKFVPALPRQVIQALSDPGDLVLDPFSGGGTTGVEAVLAGRGFLGVDANAVGVAVGEAKTTALDDSDRRVLASLEAFLMALTPAKLSEQSPSWVPDIPNVGKWYDEHVFHSLGVIRDQVIGLEAPSARKLALVSFIQAAARLSFQDSETRYASRPRPVTALEAARMVLRELRRMRGLADRIDRTADRALFVEGDAREVASFRALPQPAGLVVTSPPYPNAYDYHLYHRFRLYWLGHDPNVLRKVEVGSHLTGQQADNAPEAYALDLRRVLANCFDLLTPERWAVFVVGDGVFKGEVFRTAALIEELSVEVGFENFLTVDRALPTQRRSVVHPGRRLKSEQIVFMRRPGSPRLAVVVSPNYRLFGYEAALQRRELQALGGSPCIDGDGRLLVAPTSELHRAAFVHGVRSEDGPTRSTHQQRAESPAVGSRKKHSTYFAHGIHRYKGKFYPQLAKSLLNLSGVEPGRSLVLDPFGGSGTVALEAVLSGVDAVSVDQNPIAVAIAEAKLTLTRVSLKRFGSATRALIAELFAAPPDGNAVITQIDPAVQPEIDRWFSPPVQRKLDWLLLTIRSRSPQELIPVFEVLVSDLVRDVSQQDPKDLRVRRRREELSDAPVYEFFESRLALLANRVLSFRRAVAVDGHAFGDGTVVRQNAAHPDALRSLADREVDAVVSSPPYASALPYIDTDRLSLALLYGTPPAERKSIENEMVGSREITARDLKINEARISSHDSVLLPESTVAFLSSYNQAVHDDPAAGFRRRQAPAVLLRYFESMSRVLANLHGVMRSGGTCFLVLGDSRSTVSGHRWTIPTVEEVGLIAQHRGFRVTDRVPITVTREDMIHARHAITKNEILMLRA